MAPHPFPTPVAAAFLGALALLAAGPTPASAQQKPAAARLDPALREAAGRMAGTFRLASADGERQCPVTLKTDPAGPGLGVALDKGVCAPIVFSAEVAAWLPDASGSIRLLSAQGRTVAEFTAATGGSYEALRDGDGVYFLAPPTEDDAGGATVAEVLGEWDLSRTAGTPVCRWTFLEEKSGAAGLAMAVGGGCDETLARFAPRAWRLEGGNILVDGAQGGTPIRFARQEDGSWARVPERGRPLLMTRP